MDALKFMKEFYRMCDYYSGGFCKGCPRKEEPGCDSSTMSDEELAKLISDVEKWSIENPIKTRKQDFLDKYPYALLDSENVPKACCLELGYCKSCDYVAGTGCNKCWDEPVGDDK